MDRFLRSIELLLDRWNAYFFLLNKTLAFLFSVISVTGTFILYIILIVEVTNTSYNRYRFYWQCKCVYDVNRFFIYFVKCCIIHIRMTQLVGWTKGILKRVRAGLFSLLLNIKKTKPFQKQWQYGWHVMPNILFMVKNTYMKGNTEKYNRKHALRKKFPVNNKFLEEKKTVLLQKNR